MKLVLAVHGYPPELRGGTENAVQASARALAAAGHDVLVVAGSLEASRAPCTSSSEDRDPESGARVRVLRMHRADLYFDHWHKASSAAVQASWRALLRAERPDLVHVHHWIRLTRELVALAALEGVPALVSLHDLWSSCLIAFRVRPSTKRFCDAPLAADPCVACAGSLPPRTPWVGEAQAAQLLESHRAALRRELALARAVLAPSASHAAALERYLELEPGRLAAHVYPPTRARALNRLAPLRAPRELGRVQLASFGHLAPLKGVDLLIEALRLVPEPARFALALAGGEVDPAHSAWLRERARGLAVSFHGAFESERLDEHPAARAHALVLGTRAHESYGLVLDEAFELGLPVVAPRAGALPERVHGGRGLLYESGDALALARALWRLWSEPELLPRLRAALPPAGRVGADPQLELARLLALYERVRCAGPPAPDDARVELARQLDLEHAAAGAHEAAWDAALSGAPAPEQRAQ
jgi:glycosyltransferase involved in cell wall biosynthesis